MATLTSLKLVAAKKPAQKDPVQHRRAKLSAKVVEQLHYARALNAGEVYAPTRIKTVINAEGERVQVTHAKKVKQWWFVADNGKVCLQVRYGTRVLELAKGKNSIEIANGTELLSVLEIVKKSVESGELDAQIETASSAVRARFVK